MNVLYSRALPSGCCENFTKGIRPTNSVEVGGERYRTSPNIAPPVQTVAIKRNNSRTKGTDLDNWPRYFLSIFAKIHAHTTHVYTSTRRMRTRGKNPKTKEDTWRASAREKERACEDEEGELTWLPCRRDVIVLATSARHCVSPRKAGRYDAFTRY